MPGYSNNIVATRKLNDDKKAKLGRGGDTKIREVGGRKSHVNALEAYLIDVKGKAGEEYTKKVGAGTINPYTGMPEYFDWEETKDWWVGEDSLSGQAFGVEDDPVVEATDYSFDRDEYMDIISSPEYQKGSTAALDAFWEESGIKEEDRDYFESSINKEYLGEGGFIAQQQALTEKGATLTKNQALDTRFEKYTSAGNVYDIGERSREESLRGAKSDYTIGGKEISEAYRSGKEAYGIGMGGVAESRRAAGAAYGIGQKQTGLSAQQGMRGARQQASSAASRSGLASSGTITSAAEEAKGDILGAYTGQMQSLAETRTGALAQAGLAERGVQSAWAGTQSAYGKGGTARSRLKSDWTGAQTQYGEGGIAQAGLAEDKRSTIAGADITFKGAWQGADITRGEGQLTADKAISDIGYGAEQDYWQSLMDLDLYS